MADQTDKQTIKQILPLLPAGARPAAERNLPFVVAALRNEGILTPRVLAYALATISHETAGTFAPIREYSGRQQAIKYGYGGGENYYGRGFIQLTHLGNYKEIGERIGMGNQLATNPDLALDPIIAAKILAAFFKDRGVSDLAERGLFDAARRPVNPDNKGPALAKQANRFEQNISGLKTEIAATPTQTPTPRFLDTFIPEKFGFVDQALATEPKSTLGYNPPKQQPSHTVKSGETLWGLSEKYLGSGARWGELGYQGDPKKMPVGTKINIPQQIDTSYIGQPRSYAFQSFGYTPPSQSSGQSSGQRSPTPVPTPSAYQAPPAYSSGGGSGGGGGGSWGTPVKTYPQPKPAPRPTPVPTPSAIFKFGGGSSRGYGASGSW